jgi:hypothetical protein
VEVGHEELDRAVPSAGLLGYLNFSDGRSDPRWQKQLNDAFALLAETGESEPWRALAEWLTTCASVLQDSGATAFRDVQQARGVLAVFPAVLAAYRRHHVDLLFHQSDRDLFQPFFLARVFEAILAQGPPWEDQQRIVQGAVAKLNDFVGHRPIAILETRPRGEPYDHERVRPIPLYLRGAGVAHGRYHDIVHRALEILEGAEPAIQIEAGFDPRLLDELAVDPRAYDHAHPANRRPNYVFGEWDPHQLDGQGRFRRYVVRQVTLDALLDYIERRAGSGRAGCVNPPSDSLGPEKGTGPLESRVPSPFPDRDELLFEAAAVLAGTILMATGISGASPTSHDSSATLAALMPGIARYRDAFYVHLMQALPDAHATRLREEQAATRQPFGAARQHLNHWLARHRAAQLQQRFLTHLFAEMGYPEASRAEAAKIPAASVRMLSEILGRVALGQLHADRHELAQAAALLPEIDDLLRRGIACGALADPWNILGFQGLFPLSPAREDAIRHTRIDELVQVVDLLLNLHARLSSEAAAVGDATLARTVTTSMARLATWWDRFASVEVSDVHRVSGGEALESARHVATALARWHERGEAVADLTFWRQHLEGFRSPKSFALVVDALLRRDDYRAAMGLLISWVSQAEQVPLEDGEYSFHTLALRWMLGQPRPKSGADDPTPGPELVRKFFDYLEANAEEYWQVPALESDALANGEEAEEADALFEAAYEGVTYRDSTDDDQEGEVIGGDEPRDAFELEAEGEFLGKRLRFLSTVARLWQIAARRVSGSGDATPKITSPVPASGPLAAWLATAQNNQRKLLGLLDALHAHPIPEPLGSYDSLVEFDRRRVLKEQLVHAAIGTCLDNFLAVGSLQGALDPGDVVTESGTASAAVPHQDRPDWEPLVIRLEAAFFKGDSACARALLPPFLKLFEKEPLLSAPLGEGSDPRQVLRVRIAQTIARALAANLPRLGLLRETYHVLRTAHGMEQAHRPAGRGVTEFNHLFQAAYQAVVESVVDSVPAWPPDQVNDKALVELLETITGPFLTLWIEHSRALQLSTLETAASAEQWQRLREFVKRYGSGLFHTRFMTLANLRGILHRGVGAFLDYLRDNPDPLTPIRLLDDLGDASPEKGTGPRESRVPSPFPDARDEALGHLQFVLQAIVENYEEYKDYNTTTAHSDYGENLHVLLDFLRLKASYERHAWQFRPLVRAHEVLARSGWGDIAVLWEEAFAQLTRELAAQHLEELARLERLHGVRLGTVADRLGEKFVKPLAVDRLCALIEPAIDEARAGQAPVAFGQLQQELQAHTARPIGVGLDVPLWLRQLEGEVRRVRAGQAAIAVLATNFFQLPQQTLAYDDLQQQLQDWEKPLGTE